MRRDWGALLSGEEQRRSRPEPEEQVERRAAVQALDRKLRDCGELFEAQILLRCEAQTKGRAKVAMAALVAAFRPLADRNHLRPWGLPIPGRDAARDQLWIDFGFMLAYGAFLGLAGAAVRDLCRRRGLRRLAGIGSMAAWFGPIAAAFDALENACLLLTLDGAGAVFPVLATIFAACKFVLVGAAIGYLIAGIAAGIWRKPPPRPTPMEDRV